MGRRRTPSPSSPSSPPPSTTLADPVVAPSADDERSATDRRRRRRERTRTEIAEIALRLAIERGYDHVTVDDIAEEADIAARTFFRYFASKDDVFFLDRDERLRFLRDAIRSRPADEPIGASVDGAVLLLAETFEEDRERILSKARLLQDTPSLRARSVEHQSQWQRVIAEALAERLGVDPDRDLRCQVLAATTVAAMQAAVNVWLAGDGRRSIRDLVAEAIDLARSCPPTGGGPTIGR